MDIFENSQYGDNSQTQEKQGDLLLKLCDNFSDDGVTNILDIGCGDGTLTRKVDKMYGESYVIGIDSSKEQIKNASDKYENIDFYNMSFPSSTFKENKFDLIISNCSMHWIDEQKESYEELNRIISDDGIIVIHQGHKGCYSEMKRLAKDILVEMGYDEVSDWEYPIDYHTKSSIKEIIESCNLSLEFIEVVEADLPEDIFTDYANAGLLNFKEIVEDDWKEFEKQFLKRSTKELKVEDINSKRLYFVCETE